MCESAHVIDSRPTSCIIIIYLNLNRHFIKVLTFSLLYDYDSKGVG